jgi:hypothetical protein
MGTVGTYIYNFGHPGAMDVTGRLGISGWLKDEGGRPLPGKPVEIYVDGVLVRTVTTDAYGQFALLYRVGSTEVSHLVEARFRGDEVYGPSSASFWTEAFKPKM